MVAQVAFPPVTKPIRLLLITLTGLYDYRTLCVMYPQ